MRRRHFFGQAVGHTVLVVAAYSTTGCGTVLHPERRHRSHSGQIDWKIAAMNGLGLVLFFVPGVIAFAVDFYTGAIYLPAGNASSGQQTPGGRTLAAQAASTTSGPADRVAPFGPDRSPQVAWQRLGLKRIEVPREQLTPRRIEELVREHAGQEVSLTDAHARLSQLPRIDQFDEQLRQHRGNSNFGLAVRSFFS